MKISKILCTACALISISAAANTVSLENTYTDDQVNYYQGYKKIVTRTLKCKADSFIGERITAAINKYGTGIGFSIRSNDSLDLYFQSLPMSGIDLEDDTYKGKREQIFGVSGLCSMTTEEVLVKK